MHKSAILILSISVLLFSSCSLTNMPIEVMRPADIFVPLDIKNLAIANRSIAGKGHKVGNVVEGLFSGEGIGNDRKGSQHCVQGLVDMMKDSPRYTAVNASSEELRGKGGNQWPAPLEWDEVKEICSLYNADALITLATFDSDSRIYDGKPTEQTKTVDGKKKTYLSYPCNIDMEITAGWRIYDVGALRIVDQNQYTDVKSFDATGTSPEDSRDKLPSKNRIIKAAGENAGAQYGYRISPMWVTVNRNYFTKGHDNFKMAKDSLKEEKWWVAAKYYQQICHDPDPKIKGRACYNLAFVNEMIGYLDVAIDWVKEAEDYGIRQASSYYKVLVQRRIDAKKLDEQLKESE